MGKSWYIGFVRTKNKRRWFEFVLKKFTHVFAFTKMDDKWLVIELTTTGLIVFNCETEEIARIINNENAENISVLCTQAKTSKVVSFTLMPIYCVSFVRKLLGITELAFTPDGLYNLLLKRGAVKLNIGMD